MFIERLARAVVDISLFASTLHGDEPIINISSSCLDYGNNPRLQLTIEIENLPISGFNRWVMLQSEDGKDVYLEEIVGDKFIKTFSRYGIAGDQRIVYPGSHEVKIFDAGVQDYILSQGYQTPTCEAEPSDV